jgi:ankyrin repeat protein
MPKLSLVIFFTLVSLWNLNAQMLSSKIFTAIKENDIKAVRSFLEQGIDPNSHDEDGDRLLMYAALYSSVDCMQLLLEKGSDPNAKNSLDETALMWSVHDRQK